MWTYVPLQTTALLGPNEMCYSLTHTLANSHKVGTLFLKTHSHAAHRLSCSINMSKKCHLHIVVSSCENSVGFICQSFQLYIVRFLPLLHCSESEWDFIRGYKI